MLSTYKKLLQPVQPAIMFKIISRKGRQSFQIAFGHVEPNKIKRRLIHWWGSPSNFEFFRYLQEAIPF